MIKKKIDRKYSAIFSRLENNDCIVFRPSNIGDLGYFKRLEIEINGFGNRKKIHVDFDKETKQGVIIKDGLKVKKRKTTRNIFEFF